MDVPQLLLKMKFWIQLLAMIQKVEIIASLHVKKFLIKDGQILNPFIEMLDGKLNMTNQDLTKHIKHILSLQKIFYKMEKIKQSKVKKNKIPYWKQKGFNSKKEYNEWHNEMLDDIRHGYC